MTSLTITTNPNIDRLLHAAQRAAYGELHVIAADRGITVQGATEAQYTPGAMISINGVDLRPMINAAAMEVIVQIGNPEPVAKRRAWWRFWA